MVIEQFLIFVFSPLSLFLWILIVMGNMLYTGEINILKRYFPCVLLFYIVFTSDFIPNLLIKSFEDRSIPFSYNYKKGKFETNEKYICILGSSNRSDTTYCLSEILNNSSMKRLIEGLLISYNINDPQIILSGGSSEFEEYTNAEAMLKLISSLNISTKNIIIEKKSKDTFEQAMNIKDIIGGKPVILVTSALHMPRAIKIFKNVGITVIPAPTDYLRNNINNSVFWSLRPKSINIKRLEALFYEIGAIIKWNISKKYIYEKTQ